MKDSIDFTRFLQVKKAAEEGYDTALETAAKRSGVTKQEADLLLFFFRNEEYGSSSAVVKIRGFSEDCALEILERLEKRGLVQTAVSAGEVSARSVTVTGRGAIIAKSLNNAAAKYFEQLLSGITEGDKAVLKRILDAVYDNSLKF